MPKTDAASTIPETGFLLILSIFMANHEIGGSRAECPAPTPYFKKLTWGLREYFLRNFQQIFLK